MTRPPYDTIALVLQGGGALGAYQAGVWEGLEEAGIEPDWVAGISIGAINAALIAGNAPGERVPALRRFWDTVTAAGDGLAAWPEAFGAALSHEGAARQAWNTWHALRAMTTGQPGFFRPRGPAPWLGLSTAAGNASYYDTSPLADTLAQLVDFERINRGPMRLQVSAVNVETGNFEIFDNQAGRWKGHLNARHILASGALPPGFPAVAIPGPPGEPHGVSHYWDGGLVSNTPLAPVLDAAPRRDTLAFQVDLWNARGPLPTQVVDVQERMKDIQYSSRTRAVTDMLGRDQHQRRLLRELLARVPPELREGDRWCREAAEQACSRCVNVVHLIYQDKAWDGVSKDFEFGPVTMRDHWASGLADIRKTLERPRVLARPHGEDAFVTHDIHREHGAGHGVR